MIRTSKHIIPKHTNTNKLHNLDQFIDEYKNAVTQYIDYLWNNEIVWGSKNTIFNISKDQLNTPSMISTTNIKINTKLSARALKCASTQACAVIKSITTKRRKRLYIRDKLKQENKDYSKIQEKLDNTPLTKPAVPNNFKCELNSICADWIYINSSEFTGYLQLKSLGQTYNKIRIPIKYHRQANKWKKKGIQLNSFLVSRTHINIRWDIEVEQKTKGLTVGADTGKIDIVSLSNRKTTPKTNNHNYSLDSILQLLSRRKKGSNRFKKAQEHRKNFINWSINQLNLKDIKQINLEQIKNIRYKKRTNREMSHWTHKQIQDKLLLLGEECGVRIKLQSSRYRSQRCSKCGFVHSKNRNKKVFICLKCGFTDDADINAAINHETALPPIPIELSNMRLNHDTGFYWKSDGFYSAFGGASLEFTVPSILEN